MAAAPPERSRDRERTQSEILDVATKEFAEHGYSGARVDEIAERTRTTKRMLYYYFGSKAGLYRAILEGLMGGLAQRGLAEIAPDTDPAEAIRTIVRVQAEALLARPHIGRLIIRELVDQHKGLVFGLIARGPTPLSTETGVDQFASVLMLRRLIREEPSRPANGRYVYAHAVLPHGPHVMDPECRYVGKREDNGAQARIAGYLDQTVCGLRLVAEFLDELRAIDGRVDGQVVGRDAPAQLVDNRRSEHPCVGQRRRVVHAGDIAHIDRG